MKKRILLLLLLMTTVVGCGKSTDIKKENSKTETTLTEEQKNEIINKVKEREINKIKAETHKELLSKFIKHLSEFSEELFIIDYNTNVDAITFLATENSKEEMLNSIKNDTDETLKEISKEFNSNDLSEFFPNIQYYFLHPEKPDTVAFIYKDGELTRVKNELNINDMKIEGEDKVSVTPLTQDEIKDIKLKTKKEFLSKIVETFQNELGNEAKIEYSEKFDAFTMTPTGDAKEGLSLMLENKNNEEAQSMWKESSQDFVNSSKELSEVLQDATINIMHPNSPDKILLSIKNGEILEDNFLK